jgi:probable HAF family extracellular repeat protein
MKSLRTSFLLAAAITSIQADAQTLEDLGSLAGSAWSYGNAISANGLVVVGESGTSTGDRAFRWTGGVMTSLGTLPGGLYSYAYAVSADGSVVVGSATNDSNQSRAYRWTSAGGMENLGTLAGGDDSAAYGVSSNGSVVVGNSDSSTGQRAFRWTGGLMADLGTLPGGSFSYAAGVSADGLVVVGSSYNSTGAVRAFRWTDGLMTDLGTLAGGNHSYAKGVSANGSVVVGQSGSSAGQRAFRWMDGVMTSLGTLPGGSSSGANGVSADGSVVVGYASNASNQTRAFRWTSAGGMENLGTLPGGYSSYATGASADGSVVVGTATNAAGDEHAFLYRNSTMLDVDAWLSSVNGNSRVYTAGWTLAGLPMEGAHHRPMMSFDRMGKESQAWATGDFGSSSRTRDVHVTTGEAGLNWNVGKTGLIGFAAGHGVQNQDLAYEGSSATKGDFLLAEFDYRPEGTQWIVSLLGMIGSWESKINRGYITGAGADFSHGVADIITRSARLRVDAPSVASFGGFSFAPYASYTVTQTVVSAYAETGGSFAASFEEQDHSATEARLGVTAAKDLSEKTKLLLTVEAVHRFDGVGPALIGQEIAGGLAFNQPGTAPRPDCVRLGFDVDHKLSADTLLNISAHVASVGEAHDVSAAISIRRAF